MPQDPLRALEHLARRLCALWTAAFVAAALLVAHRHLEDTTSQLRADAVLLQQHLATRLADHRQWVQLAASAFAGDALLATLARQLPEARGFALVDRSGAPRAVRGVLAALRDLPPAGPLPRVGAPDCQRLPDDCLIPLVSSLEGGGRLVVYFASRDFGRWLGFAPTSDYPLAVFAATGQVLYFAQPEEALVRPLPPPLLHGQPSSLFPLVAESAARGGALRLARPRHPASARGALFVAREVAGARLFVTAAVPLHAFAAGYFGRMAGPALLFGAVLLAGFLFHRHARRTLLAQLARIDELAAWQRAVLDAAEFAILALDAEQRVVEMNPAAEALIGCARAEARGLPLETLFGEALPRPAAGARTEGEARLRRRDGSEVVVYYALAPLREAPAAGTGWLLLAADRSQAKRLEALLEARERLFRTLFDGVAEAVFLVEGERFADCNAAACAMFRCRREELLGKTPVDFSPPLQPDGTPSELAARERLAAALAGRPQRFEWRHRRADGTLFLAEVALNRVVLADRTLVVGFVRDISEVRLLAEQLDYQARHDRLTGLPNRAEFLHRFESLAGARRRLACLWVELVNLPEIERSLGSRGREELLLLVADQLRGEAAQGDFLARVDASAFALLCESAQAEAAARRLVAALRHPLPVLGLELSVAVAVGIARCPEDAASGEELLRRSAVAAARAAETAERVFTYDPELEPGGAERFRLAGELAGALERGEILLHYQPRIHLASGRVAGLEALARWQHPQRGLLMPSAFIALAEGSELAHPFTAAVIAAAGRDAAHLWSRGWRLPVAVNLSARNVGDEGCKRALEEALARHRLPAEALEVEVTEAIFLQDLPRAAAFIEHLARRGIRVAIDDFGTGFSSLAYLRRLPVAALKIDRAFVADLDDDPRSERIVQAAIQLAHGLGLAAVAEGVEHAALLDRLAALGCDEAQGYAICRPLPLEALQSWLAARTEVLS
ncbi:MAG: hypothetical protein KatS3mg124_1203 [Porticoccaceae bacterium]|nr:MAG: hypothetical protein KatS3mg124_1203 [Porticoccaceae bacterium]